MKKTVVVTGACGFIGTHLVDELVKCYEVFATDLSTAPKDFLNPKATFIPLDFTDREKVAEFFGLPAIKKDAEIVFHLGAIFDFYPPDSVMFQNNVIGTKNILQGFRQLESSRKRLILYSSGAIYGDTAKVVSAGEDFPADPKSAYARSKCGQEKVLERLRSETYSEWLIIRPAAVIGPRSRYGAAKILELIAGGQLQFFIGKKNLIAALVHVEDLVNATLYLAECNWSRLKMITGSEIPVFNVVDDSRYSYEELISYVADLLKESHRARIIPIHLPVWMLKPIVKWQGYLAKKYNTKPKLTGGLLGFFETPMTMNNFALKAAGFDDFKYPDTKEAIKETLNWYLKERWI